MIHFLKTIYICCTTRYTFCFQQVAKSLRYSCNSRASGIQEQSWRGALDVQSRTFSASSRATDLSTHWLRSSEEVKETPGYHPTKLCNKNSNLVKCPWTEVINPMGFEHRNTQNSNASYIMKLQFRNNKVYSSNILQQVNLLTKAKYKCILLWKLHNVQNLTLKRNWTAGQTRTA